MNGQLVHSLETNCCSSLQDTHCSSKNIRNNILYVKVKFNILYVKVKFERPRLAAGLCNRSNKGLS